MAGRTCCNFCFTFILTSGLTALFLWLSLRASNPTCSIQQFYVPALNKTANLTSNHSIYLDIKLDNQNKDKGIYYDTLNITVYYGTNQSFSVGNFSAKGFYQGLKKSTHRKNVVEPYKAISEAVFRVNLATAVRFKIMGFKSRRHRINVWAQVDVNESGQKTKKKGIKLKSGAPAAPGFQLQFVVILFTIPMLSFWC